MKTDCQQVDVRRSQALDTGSPSGLILSAAKINKPQFQGVFVG
jgi:hypothetical protein